MMLQFNLIPFVALSLSSLSFFTLLRPLPSSYFDSMISQIMLTYFVILCEAIIAVPTADLLFYLFTFSCFAYVERKTDLFPWSNPNQSNRRYSAILPLMNEVIILWISPNHCRPLFQSFSCFRIPKSKPSKREQEGKAIIK